jgi:hypothetical protein
MPAAPKTQTFSGISNVILRLAVGEESSRSAVIVTPEFLLVAGDAISKSNRRDPTHCSPVGHWRSRRQRSRNAIAFHYEHADFQVRVSLPETAKPHY